MTEENNKNQDDAVKSDLSKDKLTEKLESQEKISFKKHPAFEKIKRTDSLKGARQSRENPFMMINNQHQAHKLRALKISLSIFLVGVIAIVGSYLMHEWQKRQKRIEKLEAITKRLAVLEKQKTQSSGYDKDKIALEAIKLIERAVQLDNHQNYRKWLRQREEYFNAVAGNFPVLGLPKPENFVNATVLADMVHIPAGRFNMGCRSDEDGDDYELPRHVVSIPYEFWIARTETTNSEFRRLFPNHNSLPFGDKYNLNSGEQPVVRVDWHIAVMFCQMLTSSERKAGRLPKGYEYRLPTEAEWEYACRGGTDTIYYWGDNFGKTGAGFANSLDKYTANFFGWRKGRDMAPNDGYRVSAPVARFKPNSFGLNDMSGNVWEWCYDWYNPKAYRQLPAKSPVQLTPLVNPIRKMKNFDATVYVFYSTSKVIRGGSWGNLPVDCRSAVREHAEPERKETGIGFRVVLAPQIKTKSK